MDFSDKVNSIKKEVLSNPRYKGPINAVLREANEYTSEKKIEDRIEDYERLK